MIYVIAGNYQQFRQYEYDHYMKYGYQSHGSLMYVRDVNTLRGISTKGDIEFAAYGTWSERKDIDEIHEALHYILNIQSIKTKAKIW